MLAARMLARVLAWVTQVLAWVLLRYSLGEPFHQPPCRTSRPLPRRRRMVLSAYHFGSLGPARAAGGVMRWRWLAGLSLVIHVWISHRAGEAVILPTSRSGPRVLLVWAWMYYERRPRRPAAATAALGRASWCCGRLARIGARKKNFSGRNRRTRATAPTHPDEPGPPQRRHARRSPARSNSPPPQHSLSPGL